MTNKTRVRLARVAAGAVIIAGASLTAAGAAQAVGGHDDALVNVTVQNGTDDPPCEVDPLGCGEDGGAADGGADG
ncbi:hypothetical protein ACFRFJ_28915, partial [Streptomyces hydrogenans]